MSYLVDEEEGVASSTVGMPEFDSLPEISADELNLLMPSEVAADSMVPDGANNEEVGEGLLGSVGDDEEDSEPDEQQGGEDDLTAAAEGDNNAALLDDAALESLDKKAAKKLGKQLYKRWKKLYKKHKKSSDKGHSSSKKEKSRKEDKKDRLSKKESNSSEKQERHEKVGRKKKHQKSSSDDDGVQDLPMDLETWTAGGNADEPRAVLSAGRGKTTTNGKKAGATQRVPAAVREQQYQAEARQLIAMMRSARSQDDHARSLHEPALSRFSITEQVALVCRRVYMHPALVENGILEELAHWLYDVKHSELGPMDLRSLALELLLLFEYRGCSTSHQSSEGSGSGKKKKGDEIDDLTKFRGICREDLEGISLGVAVNRLKNDKGETQRNQVLGTQLLQRLSRAFRSRRDDDDDPPAMAEVQWRCKGDPSVAPPFDPVKSSSDEFQQRMFQPDPLDPLSYLRVPPKRYQKGYVTNLSHIKVK